MKQISLIGYIITILLLVGCGTPAKNPSLEQDREAAAKKLPNGLNNMGSRYQYGDGVPKDYKKAFSFYQQAVNQGLTMAKTNLGFMYDNGLGVKQNKQKAISLYKSAANHGDPRGMINLGEMYRTGDHIEKSLKKACEWYDKARFATQGSSDKEAKWAARGALETYCH